MVVGGRRRAAPTGAPVTWNLVDGLHDGAEGSERAVWVDGAPAPRAAAAVPRPRRRRRPALHRARDARAQRENLLLIASDYEQPFGTFAGALPVAGPLRAGWGVMERHRVRW